MAALNSSFSPSLKSLKSLSPTHKHCQIPITLPPTSQFYGSIEPLSVSVSGIGTTQTHKWHHVLRVTEEAVGVTAVDDDTEDNKSESEDGVSTKLYFGNLPYNVDSAMLAGIIQQYATPELIEVLYNRVTGKSRGFAFVTMSSIEDCETIVQNLDGMEYLGRTLRVNFSDQPRAREALYPETEYKLFVGNLSWSATSENLEQAFREYGNVVGARVLYDGDTGKSRGYGFVCYSTKSEMEAALELLNGVELEGRAMRVSLAEGKKS